MNFVQVVTGRAETIQGRLKKSGVQLPRKGLLSEDYLHTFSCTHLQDERDVVLELCCRYDLLMKVQVELKRPMRGDEMVAIPVLFPVDKVLWNERGNKSELVMKTKFPNVIPLPVTSIVTANLRRTVEVSGEVLNLLELQRYCSR